MIITLSRGFTWENPTGDQSQLINMSNLLSLDFGDTALLNQALK